MSVIKGFNGAVSVSLALSVDMGELVEYDTPEQCPEWQWLATVCQFEHEENDEETATYEMVLNLSRYEDMMSNGEEHDTPDTLKPLLDLAVESSYEYVVFYQ